jgi:DedD protein
VPKPPISDEELHLRKRARRRLVGAILLVLLVVVLVPMFLEREPRQQRQDVDIRIPPVPGQAQAPSIPDPPEPPTAPASAPEATALPQPASPAPSEPTTAAPGAGAQLPPIEVPAIPPPGQKPSSEAAKKPPSSEAAKPPASQTAPRPAPVEQRRIEAVAKAATANNGGDTTPAAAPGDRFVIQLGAFSDAGNAKQLLQQLKKQKFPAYSEVVMNPQGDKTRVRVGPYPSVEAAEKARDRLKALKLVSAASNPTVVRMEE